MARIVYKPHRVELETPYVQLFVDEMRNLPSRSRSWVPERRVWVVYEPYVEQAVKITLNLFPNAETVGTPTSGSSESGSGGNWGKWQDTGYQYRERSSNGHRSNWKEDRTGSGRASEAPRTGGDHATLFVTLDAPETVVRASYKALAIMYHPDRSDDPGATRKMQDVNAAYGRIKKLKGWK